MKLTDLAPQEVWEALVQDVHGKFGISCAVSDADGGHATHHENWCNRLCPKIKAKPEAVASICAIAAQNFTMMTRQMKKPVIEECDIGLIKIAVPIFAGDAFLGTAGGCGFLAEDGEVEEFMVGKATGLDDDEIAELTNDITVISKAGAGEIADYTAARITEIVAKYESK